MTKENYLRRNGYLKLTLLQIFELCGIPTEENWPGYKRLPNAKSLRLPRTQQK